MLYWICPECGHECSPAIRECPTCTAAEKAAPASQDILSLAQTFQSAPGGALLTAAPPRNLIAANGHSAPSSVAVITAEEAADEPPAEPKASFRLAALDGLVVQPSHPASSQPVKPEVSPVPARATAPALVAAESPRAEFRLKLAGLAPTGEIAFQAALLRQPKAHELPMEPAPSRRRSVAFIREALLFADTNELAVAGFAPPSEVLFTPPKGGNETAVETNVAPLGPKAGSLAFISSKIELVGESLSDLFHALQTSAAELERAAIRAIQASFLEMPAASLLCAPREVVTAPAPPTEQWMRSPRLVFIAKAPGNAARAALRDEPQPPTLAGPCLPPQLLNLTESRGSRHRPPSKSAATSTWLVSIVVIALFLGGGSLLQYLTANRDAKAASVAPAPTETREAAPAPPLPAVEEHPGARFVEVAGVRVVTAPNHKPQLQYIVINHSAGELTGLNIHIALRSADSPSGPPLIRVSSIVPSLGANQSKEIRMDLDAGLGAASVPDWQSLRTEILIGRQ
jgi:hypothetical protein